MRVFTITRNVLVRILLSPGGVFGSVALLSTLPILLVLAPYGISSANAISLQLSYEVAFMGQAAGVLLGLAALERIAPVLAREPAEGRLVWEFSALLASGLIGAVLPLLSGLVCGAVSAGGAAAALAVRILPSLTATAASAAVIIRLCRIPGVALGLCASGILLTPMILSQPIPPRSLVVMTVGLAVAAWLLDHAPITARRARSSQGAR